MSSSIWTRCAATFERIVYDRPAWRVVEAQHQVSTRKLVDSDAEQLLLEQLIDSAKPPDLTHGHLHYLLFTPFRYPPLRYGSRFARRTVPSLWYGSESLVSAFAEVAYYRFVFREGTRALLGTIETELTAFQVDVYTEGGGDLTAPPFDAFRAVIASPVTYDETQALGDDLREAGVEVLRYPSARDPEGGSNVGIFVPSVFRSPPRALESWHCSAGAERVELARRDYFNRAFYTFSRDIFVVDGAVPAPAL
jgi:RES domain